LQELDKAAMDMGKRITQKSTLALDLSKASLDLGIYLDIEQTLE
jgi:hypothetical protein